MDFSMLELLTVCTIGRIQIFKQQIFKIKIRMANSVDSDETAHYEPSSLDPHCSQKNMFPVFIRPS